MSLRNGWHDRLDRLQRLASRTVASLRASSKWIRRNYHRLRVVVRESIRCRECGAVTPLTADVCQTHCTKEIAIWRVTREAVRVLEALRLPDLVLFEGDVGGALHQPVPAATCSSMMACTLSWRVSSVS